MTFNSNQLAELLHSIFTAWDVKEKWIELGATKIVSDYLYFHNPRYSYDAIKTSINKWLNRNSDIFRNYTVDHIYRHVVIIFIERLRCYGLK
jgi:glycosidase